MEQSGALVDWGKRRKRRAELSCYYIFICPVVWKVSIYLSLFLNIYKGNTHPTLFLMWMTGVEK
jgi:hypothetical protein